MKYIDFLDTLPGPTPGCRFNGFPDRPYSDRGVFESDEYGRWVVDHSEDVETDGRRHTRTWYRRAPEN